MAGYIGRIQKAIAELGPWFLQQKNIGTFLEAVGLTLDGAVEQLVQGMRLGQPLRCDPSALPILSRDRRIRIYETEPDASKRYRLSRFWPLRRQFGTHQGEMRNVQPFFLDRPALPVMRIVHQAGDGSVATWHTLLSDGSFTGYRADPSNWDFDGVSAKWARWWCVIYTSGLGLASQPVWDGGQLWDQTGPVWDGIFSAAQIDDLVAALREAKSAHSILWGLILCTNSTSFNPSATAATNPDGSTTLPTGNWGSIIDPTTGVPTRGAPGASFVYDLGQG